MPKLESLEPLMIDELRDILDAEKQIAKALPKMARSASAEELKNAFNQHLEQTNQQVERLGEVFEHLGERARGKKCLGMQSLIEEGEQMLEETEPGPTRDALLISAAQKVEHYEMAAYGTARTYANLLGHSEAASLLEETLDEEKHADVLLTQIAESISNPEAAGQPRGNGRRQMEGMRGRASSQDRSRGRASGNRAGSSRGRASSGSKKARSGR